MPIIYTRTPQTLLSKMSALSVNSVANGRAIANESANITAVNATHIATMRSSALLTSSRLRAP